jgi:hypothetical protein
MRIVGLLILIAVAGCTSVDRSASVSSIGSEFESARPADLGQADSCSGQPWSWCTGYRERP